MERRSTFLSKSDWTSLPWQGFKRPIATHLLDLTASMASIVESGYRLLDKPAKPLEPSELLVQALRIVSECWKLDVRLRAFYNRLDKEVSGPVYWAELSSRELCPVEDPTLGTIFPVSFRFPDLKTARICMLYWATLSILWSGMGFLYQVLAGFELQYASSQGHVTSSGEIPNENRVSPSFSTSQLPPLEHRADVATLAKNICQSLEFCMKVSKILSLPPCNSSGRIFQGFSSAFSEDLPY
jgi:hypothetical protein